MRPVKNSPYGSWKSPITGSLLASGSGTLWDLTVDDARLYWLELQPEEGGRYGLFTGEKRESPREAVPKEFNVRTRVHEYGGGAYVASGQTVYFSNFKDQLVYRIQKGGGPAPISRPGHRYADFVVDGKRERLLAVDEDHTTGAQLPVNTISWIKADGTDAGVLVSGNDFYSSPRLDPSGARVAWVTWNFPNMPWDGTELWTARVSAGGEFVDRKLVAGGREESVIMPAWSPDGTLHFVSDRSGYWNIYRFSDGRVERVLKTDSDVGVPQWSFRTSTYDFGPGGMIVFIFSRDGVWHLGILEPGKKEFREVKTPYSDFSSLRAAGASAFLLAGSPAEPLSVVELDLEAETTRLVRRPGGPRVGAEFVSTPRHIIFPTTGRRRAYGFLYLPRNGGFRAPQGEKPPLLVMSHGGPTSQARTSLSLGIQAWTSRGFVVLDVNYGGSSGYGREYRRRLNGKWGIVDVDDCCNGAEYLARKGVVDPGRLAIRGGSAGGYTTLCALAFRKTFKAGASHYGLSDLLGFVESTHKFEYRYNDILVAPYPEGKKVLKERSALYSADRITAPMIFFQGLDDVIVPPAQAEAMVKSLRARGVPVAYVPFKGEMHGFRKSENIRRAFEAELYFYSKFFGFSIPGSVEPVKIWNLPRGR